jgi:hypothetical protein
MAAGVMQDRAAQRLQLQRRQNGAHIAKGFVEGCRFMARSTQSCGFIASNMAWPIS